MRAWLSWLVPAGLVGAVAIATQAPSFLAPVLMIALALGLFAAVVFLSYHLPVSFTQRAIVAGLLGPAVAWAALSRGLL